VGSTLYRRAMSFTVTSPKPLSVIRGIEEDGTAQLSALAAGCCEEVRHMPCNVVARGVQEQDTQYAAADMPCLELLLARCSRDSRQRMHITLSACCVSSACACPTLYVN
jgi:hypothetical protein